MFEGLRRGHYRVVLADPPWAYKVFTAAGLGRSAERHYSTMSIDAMKEMPVAELAARDAHLFMWITGPLLVEGRHVELMRAWGFEPSAMAFVWLKIKRGIYEQGHMMQLPDENLFGKGMGHTTRQNAEYVLLGRRGSPKRLRKDIHQIIVAPRREHSRKPDEIYDRIEAYAAGPFVELFARQRRPGWAAWGNQVDRFTPAPSLQPDMSEMETADA